MRDWISENTLSLILISPELILSLIILSFILICIVIDRNRRKQIVIPLSILGLSIYGLSLLCLSNKITTLPAFGGLLTIDTFGIYFKITVSIATVITFIISVPSKEIKSERFAEYTIFLFTALLGISFLVSSTHFLMLYLSLEILSIPCYLLATFSLDKKSSESGLKYMVYGAASTGIMLFGMSLIYGRTASLDLFEISGSLSSSLISSDLAVTLGLIFILIGLGYKTGFFPFHMWVPDVFEGAPTPVTAFFSVAPKTASIAVIARLFMQILDPCSKYGNVDWPMLFAVISAITMSIGNLCALPQTDVKRLLAYSSIAHIGYIFMGLAVPEIFGMFAINFYIFVYTLMNIGAFSVVSVLGKSGINEFNGFGRKSPLLSVAMTVFLFSLTGIPPLAGFIGKYYLFISVLNIKMYWLVLLAVLNSVVSLYYYARIIKAMYFEVSETDSLFVAPFYIKFTIFLIMLLVFILGIYWVPLIYFVNLSLSYHFTF
ncbi:MAG: NADH-quinone oxidoreductase subunit N [Candidatus Hydrogenedentota bacterium]